MHKKALVLGAGGFIGSHLVRRLKSEGYWVRGVDLKYPEYSQTEADEFIIGDLRKYEVCSSVMRAPSQEKICRTKKEDGYWYQTEDLTYPFDRVYQLAADMGGAGYIFTGEHDADVMHNSAQINLNIAHLSVEHKVGKVFYSSSACCYPAYNQEDPQNPSCYEDSAYPAAPDSEYGWEKLFSERLYLAYARNYGLKVRIARFHNIYGIEGSYVGGREKAPAAMSRKVAMAKDGGEIEVWGDGLQTRSFLYVDYCVDGIMRLVESDFTGPVNIGSEEMVSINQLAQMAIDISGKKLTIKNVPSNALGVRGRNSDNKLIQEKLGWAPNFSLRKGMELTYAWINGQVQKNNRA